MESSAAAKAVRGVSSEGFTTTVQPHARAGPTWKIRKQIILKMTDVHKLIKSLKNENLSNLDGKYSKQNIPFE